MIEYHEEDTDPEAAMLIDAIIEDTGTADCGHRVLADEVCPACQRCIDCCICDDSRELTDRIKAMPRDHLENLARYIVQQRHTGFSAAPDRLTPIDQLIWMEGFERSRGILVELLTDPTELKRR